MKNKIYCILTCDDDGKDILSGEMDLAQAVREAKKFGGDASIIEVTRKYFDLDAYKKKLEKEMQVLKKELDSISWEIR